LAGFPILKARLRRWCGLRAPVVEAHRQNQPHLATILVVAALGFDFIAPLFLNS
jgi:hypothetical protein